MSSASQSQIESIYSCYAALTGTAPLDAGHGLGGKLLFAGEIAGAGSDLLFAANIAGVASLAASADVTVQRLAMRDGAVDFLVTSLAESLRILKNEVRKRQTVSVAVAADPRSIVEQMLDRGVLPDLLPPASMGSAESSAQMEAFVADGAVRMGEAVELEESGSFVTWSVDREFPRWLPLLNACVAAVVPGEDPVRQRWLRLAPRYLGRMAQKQHGVMLTAAELAEFRLRAAEVVGAGVALKIDTGPGE